MGSAACERVTMASFSRNALEAQHLAGEDEGVAGRELLDEIFLDLAEHAAGREHAGRA